MNTLLKQRDVVTRKAHVCWSCGTKYPPKTNMEYTVQVDAGHFMCNYWCQCCKQFMSLLDPWDLEVIGWGDFCDYDGYKEFREQWEATHDPSN